MRARGSAECYYWSAGLRTRREPAQRWHTPGAETGAPNLNAEWLPLQFAFQDLAGQAGIRFALAGFHYLALEEIQRGELAGLEISGGTGIRGDDFVAEFFDGARVADLREAFLFD